MASHPSALLAMSLTLAASGALAQANDAANVGGPSSLPAAIPLSASNVRPFTPNTMMDPITPEARRTFLQTSLAQSPLSIRELINLVTYKVAAQPGLSWDDVITSMKLRANKINLKFIGTHPVHKEIEAMTGKPTPRVEIYHFCDALLARELLDYSLEFAAFLPCRIAVVEDAQRKIWPEKKVPLVVEGSGGVSKEASVEEGLYTRAWATSIWKDTLG